MTETYKIVTVAPVLDKGSMYVTRGNDMRLQKSYVKYEFEYDL